MTNKIAFQLFRKLVFALILFFATHLSAQGPEEYIELLTSQYDTTTDSHQKIDLKIAIEEAKYNLDAVFWKSLAVEAHLVNHQEAEAKCLNNVGFIYTNQGKREEAIEYYHLALNIYRHIGSGIGLAGVYNDLGGIYSDINESEIALKYYLTAHEIYCEVQDSVGMSMTSHNLSAQYLESNDFQMAKFYALKSLEIATKIDDRQGMPSILQNLGGILEKDGNLDSALVLYKQGFDISIEIGMIHGVAHMGISIGLIFLKKYQINNALNELLDSSIVYFQNAYKIGKEMNNVDIIQSASNCLMRYYVIVQDWKNAYSYTVEYFTRKDTIENAEKQKEVLKTQMEYQHSIEKVKVEEERKAEQSIANEKSERQFYIILIGGFVVLMLIVFVVIIIRKWNETQRQKVIIEHQKSLVEEKQKEITDSINYAQRLQQAILATPKEITKYLPENFLVFKPKDIVAGDFYFFETTDSHIFLAAADCTGHGVPGAMVSVVCSNALMRSVKEFKLTDPGKILDKTRNLIVETFKKSGSDVKDGMDISLLILNRASQKIEWAGANNPLWYVENDEMKSIKPDKQPVGLTDNPKPFTTHALLINPKTLFFLFTDGIADQFGGPNGKKYKYKSLQKLLVVNASKQMADQKLNIETAFENWKRNLEQVDDVCVIGVRI